MKRFCSKTLAVILAAIMIIAVVPFAASAATATVNGEKVETGDTITVTWNLKTDTPVVNAEFTINYPSAQLKLIDSAFPVLSAEGSFVANTSVAGKVVVTATNASQNKNELYSFAGGAALAELKFEVLAAGDAKVDIDYEYIGGLNSSGIASDEVDLIDSDGKMASGVSVDCKVASLGKTFLTINDELTAEIGESVIYEIMVQSDKPVEDVQGGVYFDPDYLAIASVQYPVITNAISNPQDDRVEFAATRPDDPYDFTSEKAVIRVKFKVIAAGNTDVVGIVAIMSSAEDSENIIENNTVIDKATTLDFVLSMQDIMLGDVDKSEKVDATDATYTLQIAAGLLSEATSPELDFAAADVDGTGKIDATDATYILQYAAGLLAAFPAE